MAQTELSEVVAAGIAARESGSKAATKDLKSLEPPGGLDSIGYWNTIEDLAAKYRHEVIGAIREEGTSWDQIGAVLGINGANARQRWMRSRPEE